jgi:hypothetical protein
LEGFWGFGVLGFWGWGWVGFALVMGVFVAVGGGGGFCGVCVGSWNWPAVSFGVSIFLLSVGAIVFLMMLS